MSEAKEVIGEKKQAPEPTGDSKKSPLASAVKIEFDYVVINCRYSSRLVSHYLDLGAEFSLAFETWGHSGVGRDPKKDRILNRETAGVRVDGGDSASYDDESDGVYVREYGDTPDYEGNDE